MLFVALVGDVEVPGECSIALLEPLVNGSVLGGWLPAKAVQFLLRLLLWGDCSHFFPPPAESYRGVQKQCFLLLIDQPDALSARLSAWTIWKFSGLADESSVFWTYHPLPGDMDLLSSVCQAMLSINFHCCTTFLQGKQSSFFKMW